MNIPTPSEPGIELPNEPGEWKHESGLRGFVCKSRRMKRLVFAELLEDGTTEDIIEIDALRHGGWLSATAPAADPRPLYLSRIHKCSNGAYRPYPRVLCSNCENLGSSDITIGGLLAQLNAPVAADPLSLKLQEKIVEWRKYAESELRLASLDKQFQQMHYTQATTIQGVCHWLEQLLSAPQADQPAPQALDSQHQQMRALIERKLATVANKSIREDLAHDLERIYGVALDVEASKRKLREWMQSRGYETGRWHEVVSKAAEIFCSPPAPEGELPRVKSAHGVDCLDPGHRYLLAALDGGAPQEIVFVKREGLRYPGNVGHHGGIIMQSLLRAISDRMAYVNGQIPCWETEIAKNLIDASIAVLECRAARTHGRSLGYDGIKTLLAQPTCEKCGHIGCAKHADQPPAAVSPAAPLTTALPQAGPACGPIQGQPFNDLAFGFRAGQGEAAAAPAAKAAVKLTHSLNCGAYPGGDDPCTCGLHWRLLIEQLREQLAAAEKELADRKAEIELAKEIHAEYRVLKAAAPGGFCKTMIDVDNQRVAAEAELTDLKRQVEAKGATNGH